MLLGDNNIVSNEALRRRIGDDIKNGTLSHAHIIEGKCGSGRHTLAKSIAAALSCTGECHLLPCGECKNCRDIFEDKCPDVILVSKDDKASLGVEAIRKLKSTLLAVPNNLEIKVYIIEDADTMTVQAQNALLLTLEEPPQNVYFFILCENSRMLLETIRSRAATLRTLPLTKQEISSFLLGELNAKPERTVTDSARSLRNSNRAEFDSLLLSADGSMGRAIELLSPKERAPINELRSMASGFISSLLPGSGLLHPLSLLPEFSSKRPNLLQQLEYIKLTLRDLILLKKCETAPLCFFTDRDSALELSDRFSEKKLFSASALIDNAYDAIQRNANVNLTLVNMLSKL